MYPRTLLFALTALVASLSAVAQAEPYLGQIMIWSAPFTPTGWAPCDGRLLSIAQNTALFSIIGTIYGGDGITTFALPNLINRVPISSGNALGVQTTIGQTGGSFGGQAPVQGSANGVVVLTADNLPAHSHSATFTGSSTSLKIDSSISVVTAPGQLAAQAGGFLSQGSNAGVAQAAIFAPSSSTANKVDLAGISGSGSFTPAGTVNVGSTGGGRPIPLNLPLNGQVPLQPPPFLAMQYLIALQGIYPSRG